MTTTGRRISLMSARDLGDHNRASILRALSTRGPLSRSELARLTDVGRGSVGAIVQRLIDDAVLQETEPVTSGNVGKPARPVWFAPGAGSVVALEPGAAGVNVAVVDAQGHASGWNTVPIADAADPASVSTAAVAALEAALETHPNVLGVGVAVPGSVNVATGEVFGCTQVPGSIGGSLVAALRAGSKRPVLVENDSRAQALAELWFGVGRRHGTFATVRTGTGIGVGIVLDGTVLRGSDGRAPEVGHQRSSRTETSASAAFVAAGRRSVR
ncbi:MAG: ROK family transcriptional regulator [Ilumatobacteraceae bacterium]